MAAFTIEARDGSSDARAGVLETAHGDVRTPAFVPLATKATVKGLLPAEVAALGYEMVLGNTFHLLLESRPRADRALRRDGPVHGLGRADRDRFRGVSGVLDGARDGGRGDQGVPPAPQPGCGQRQRGGDPRDRGGRGALSLLHGRPRAVPLARGLDGDAGGAGLRPGARVRRVHAVPRRPRVHAALDRAHAPLAGALPGVARRARAGRASSSTGSCRAACTRICGASRLKRSPRARATGWRSAARSGRRRRRCTRWWATRRRELGGEHERKPRHLLGIGEVDDLIRGVELGIDTFDCAMPTRLGRHGTALVPDPGEPLARGPEEGAVARVEGAAAGGLRVPGLRGRACRVPT